MTPPRYEALPTVTRFEVLDDTGRVLVRQNVYVQLLFQDKERTLKVFLSRREDA